MIADWRKLLDRVTIRAGFGKAIIDPVTKEQAKDKRGNLRWRVALRSKAFRHSYCAARLQTVDGGHPVSP